MAAGENQGLIIALIIFVCIALIASVTSVFAFKQVTELKEVSSRDKSELASAKAALSSGDAEIVKLKEMIGADASTDLKTVEELHKKDMEDIAAIGLPEDIRRYSDLVEQLVGTLRESRDRLTDSQQSVTSLEDTMEKREGVNEKQTEEVKVELNAKTGELANERATFDKDRTRIVADQKNLAEDKKELASKLTDAEAARAEMQQEIDRLTREKNTIIAQQNETIEELRNETFEIPDGDIRSVNHRRAVVWISLGSEDNLRRHVTFSVYDVNQDSPARHSVKGKIEVTEVLGPHLSEARITEDSITNPIIRGDKIYTPLWHPGRPQRFALAGLMDIDGDGVADREIIHDLIAIAGGIIDGELAEDGTTETGSLSFETRYLIVGNEDDKNVAKLGAWKARAHELGVQTINIDQFLDHVGYKNPTKSLRFGVTDPEQFRRSGEDGQIRRPADPSNRFRTRRPPTSPPGNNAYSTPRG
jgi:hypothetical protein